MKRIVAVSILSASGPALASSVVWDVDPAASFVRLTIPDQPVNVTGLGQVTARMRDANSTTQWTDAGGRRAALDGTVATDYADSASITFLTGQHNLFALEQASALSAADWVAVTNSPVVVGNEPQVTLTVSPGTAFYRLHGQ